MDLNPTDLIHAAPEVRNIVAIIVGGIPVAEIVKSIVVPPFAFLGKRMADRVERLFEKTGKMVQDAGITPQPVSDKLIIEIVRGASLEDNEDLHTMWAALLANAASPDGADEVRPAFVATLRQLSRDEALLLNWIYESLDRRNEPFDAPFEGKDLIPAYAGIGYGEVTEWNPDKTPKSARIDSLELQRCLDGLQADQLIRLRYDIPNPLEPIITAHKFPYSVMEAQYFSMTSRGLHFILACRPPKPTT